MYFSKCPTIPFSKEWSLMWWHGQRVAHRGQMKSSSPKCFFFLSIYKRKIIKFFIQSQKCRRASLKSLFSSCQPWIHATYYLPKSDIYWWFKRSIFCKSRLNFFFFKCWIHHFGTKLFDCKLYPGGANARRHPNALALKKAVWLQEPEKKKLRNIQVWNGKNVTLYSTHLCTHTRTHARTLTHTHARI